jgi:hypothetical protein
VTQAKHAAQRDPVGPAILVIGGTALAVSLSLNAVLYAIFNWNLIPAC